MPKTVKRHGPRYVKSWGWWLFGSWEFQSFEFVSDFGFRFSDVVGEVQHNRAP
jgi:hypothetical protein